MTLTELGLNNTLQHTATHCNTLQHAATPCNTRQALEDNTTLTELGLNNNNITDDGVASIAQMLAKNGTLSLLRLTECPIGVCLIHVCET